MHLHYAIELRTRVKNLHAGGAGLSHKRVREPDLEYYALSMCSRESFQPWTVARTSSSPGSSGNIGYVKPMNNKGNPHKKCDVLDTFQSESLRMPTLGHEPARKILGHVLQGAGGGENRKLRRRGIQLSRNPPLKVTSRMF